MRILLAEDERTLSDALVTILSHSGYSVDAVYDGQDALDWLSAGNYDCAVLDIMMPKLDGITVLKRIRAQGITLPVLLLTAKSETDDKVEGLDSGADDYMTKPFAAKELLARVRAMTRRQPELTDNLLRFGNIELSRGEHSLRGPGGSAVLANKEFQMLEMLMMNPERAISTERFLEKIWGYESEAEINVVWVNISGLRKKIAGVGGNVGIKAARGIGYLLSAGGKN
ncbi:MAG: response regulator transcription factor [Ruminiclostridium sp.]|nr:response regulator transcription factor [Ruminiclostridium sp.]